MLRRENIDKEKRLRRLKQLRDSYSEIFVKIAFIPGKYLRAFRRTCSKFEGTETVLALPYQKLIKLRWQTDLAWRKLSSDYRAVIHEIRLHFRGEIGFFRQQFPSRLASSGLLRCLDPRAAHEQADDNS